jgi:putative transposase
MNDHHQRQEAIKRYLAGQKIAVIGRFLNKSRKWVHKWINRYEGSPDNQEWYKDESKAPKKVNKTLAEETEQQILLIRNELSNEKMAQTGAISIQYEFEKRGIAPPAVWTINRVISKYGLAVQPTIHKVAKEYPGLFYHTHQMDLVGPRYIKGDGRFYSVNVIDTTTHNCFIKAVRSKSSDGIVEAIAGFWSVHGMPDALQMDNELAFRGSNRHPRSFGRVVRFALSQGVAPIFIPVKEPWRNGIIEKFNHTYGNKFLRAYTFSQFDDLCSRQQAFMDFHNTHHRYSSQLHKTPNEAKKELLPPMYYAGDMHLQKKIPLTEGCIYFIRFIRSDLKLHLPNESFAVRPALKYSYVVAEINIINHVLIIRQNGEIQQIFPYDVPVDW